MESFNDDDAAFIKLFGDAYKQCFNSPIKITLSEPESKHFSNEIFAITGLVIGGKSLKNYSAYVLNEGPKIEKPSTATLDTLARYVLTAPRTTEVLRKNNESHYPYWFRYKNGVNINVEAYGSKTAEKNKGKWLLLWPILLIIPVTYLFLSRHTSYSFFKEDFHSVADDSLTAHGWLLKNKDAGWWGKRNTGPAALTLYTLKGDNWADSVNAPSIKNLLIKKLSSDCFETEIQLENFAPKEEWQQAGLLLLEDTLLTSKSIRLSLAFNDFFGGAKHPAEIIVQAITSNTIDYTKPEEIAHLSIMNFQSGATDFIHQNLKNSALKIIKKGNHFRFLYANSMYQNFAYKEILNKDIDIQPKYAAIFAIRGFSDRSKIIPVRIKFFSINNLPCN